MIREMYNENNDIFSVGYVQNEQPDVGKFQPESVQHFLDVLNEAKVVFNKTLLTRETNSYYSKIFSNIQPSNDIDLKDSNMLKSFLAFKKLIKYKDKVSIKQKPGHFNEISPFLGEYAQYHTQLENKSVFSALEDALYESDARFNMIPKEDREKAESLGYDMLCNELTKYNTTPEEVFGPPSDFFQSVTTCCDIDNPWNDWNLQVNLDKQLSQINGKEYAPLGVIALHELGHVRQTMPGKPEQEFNNTELKELAPTIDLIVRQDEIYKQIHNTPLNQKVAYPHSVLIAGNSIEIGEIANTFRQIKQKYNFDNFEQVLLTKDAEVYVSQLTGIQKDSLNMADVNNPNIKKLATLRKKITNNVDKKFETYLEEKKPPKVLKKIEEPLSKVVDKIISNKKVNE